MRQPDGTRRSAHVLRIWPKAKSSPCTSLRIVHRRADAGERSGVQTKWWSSKKFRANAWWYALQSEVKGEASAWPKPEDMSGAVHANKHLHRQLSRITTSKANEKKLLSATLKLNHLSPFTQRQQTRLRIKTQLGARVSDVQIAHSQLANSI